MLRGARVLGEGPIAERGQVPEHLVTRLKRGHVGADRLDLPGHIQTQAKVPGRPEPGAHPRQEWLAQEVIQVGLVQG